jgi:hypothetical protein
MRTVDVAKLKIPVLVLTFGFHILCHKSLLHFLLGSCFVEPRVC